MKLLKDSSVYLMSELVSKSIPFLMLPYLTRKLGADGYGLLSYYQVYILLLAVFVGISQQAAVVKCFYRYGKHSTGLVYKAGTYHSIAVTLPFILLAILTKSLIMMYVVVTALSQIILTVQLSLRQCQKKPIEYFYIQLMVATFSVSLTVSIFEFYSASFDKRMLAILLANMLASLIASRFTGLKASSYSFKKLVLGWKYLLSFGIPLIIHQLSFLAKAQLDKIFVFTYFSASTLGVYSASFQIASVLTILITALNSALLPYYYEFLTKQKNLYVIDKWVKLGLLASLIPPLIALLLPTNVFTWFLGESFSETKIYISSLLLGLGLMIPYMINANCLIYFGDNIKLSQVSFISSVIHILIVLIVCTLIKDPKFIPVALIVSNFILFIGSNIFRVKLFTQTK